MNLSLVPELENDILVTQRLVIWFNPSICVASMDFPSFLCASSIPTGPKAKLCVCAALELRTFLKKIPET